ncbi:MAG TPA: dienelactone hydrolase family protein, partial [Steroidobacteraceae bacterium]|nr:dienelactone hydrolase family protein [Steroidobacteraceae bacterium]
MSGEFTRLMARDGHEFDAWLSPPAGAPRGAVLVLQEIFGVNSHIRAVADGFAAEGYLAIAPSLFDRVRRNVELGYTPQDVEHGRGYVAQIPEAKLLLDMQASLNVVRHAGAAGVVGYCWGGSLAYLAACELPVAAAVSYYGTRTVQYLEKRPQAPVMYHFGDRDRTIPPEAIGKIRAAHPAGEYFIYAADHGFNCDQRASFDAAAAKLARERTLGFFAQHLAPQPKAAHDDVPLD